MERLNNEVAQCNMFELEEAKSEVKMLRSNL
jgi:hypothetical protein